MTALGHTSSITLITGLPGSGKSLRSVWWMRKLIADGEMVFHTNFTGLKVPGAMPWDDPKEWPKVPAGGILFVDEAQEFFRARRAGDPPAYLTAMERIRHSGVRLVLCTQQPNYLDTHLRGLVGLHEHLIRENGKQAARIVRSNEVIDDVRAASKNAARKGLDTETWRYPKEVFDCYTSAEVHTVKYVMPSKLKRWGLVFAACAVVVLGVVLSMWNSVSSAGESPEASPEVASRPTGTIAADRNPEAQRPLTVEEYVERLVPRVALAPWSAPIFDGASPAAMPELFCMSSKHPTTGRESCTCLTEQGTRFRVGIGQCMDIARNGPAYNPFKEPPQPGTPGQLHRVEETAVEPVVVGIGTEPASVGAPEQGQVWGKAPETIRATDGW